MNQKVFSNPFLTCVCVYTVYTTQGTYYGSLGSLFSFFHYPAALSICLSIYPSIQGQIKTWERSRLFLFVKIYRLRFSDM